MAKGERKKNTENKQKMPFSGGKQGFSCIKQPKNKTKKNKTKKQPKQIRRV